ncbi:MAG: NAD(P)H-hydrate dehydratase [Planctomycetaceae bacterium]|nr:NAD(P)H-hydrate dehydratase [Planctomycetaceae bacterium]
MNSDSIDPALRTTEVTKLPKFPVRIPSGHKGTFGRVMLIAGSPGMTGAAVLAGRSALRCGSGLVYVASGKTCISEIAVGEPSYLTVRLADDDSGRLTKVAETQILQQLPQMNAFAIGPGLGRSSILNSLVNTLYHTIQLPAVFDADALNSLAESRSLESDPPGVDRVLTPHPGEFARLSGYSIREIESNRVGLAIQFAKQHDVVLVLKGPGTVVTDGHRYYINTTGNAGMAAGGSGDVLTGVILSLLGQGCLSFEAAQLGVYLHGLAGDLAAKDWTEPGLIASDLPQYVPKAIATLL